MADTAHSSRLQTGDGRGDTLIPSVGVGQALEGTLCFSTPSSHPQAEEGTDLPGISRRGGGGDVRMGTFAN